MHCGMLGNFAGRVEAVKYARSHFAPYMESHLSQLVSVMTTLMPSDYASFKYDWQRKGRALMLQKIRELFKQTYCTEMQRVSYTFPCEHLTD